MSCLIHLGSLFHETTFGVYQMTNELNWALSLRGSVLILHLFQAETPENPPCGYEGDEALIPMHERGKLNNAFTSVIGADDGLGQKHIT